MNKWKALVRKPGDRASTFADGSPICDIRSPAGIIAYDVGFEEARLIAAAPELLEALEGLLPWHISEDDRLAHALHLDREYISKARAAIKAAKGDV